MARRKLNIVKKQPKSQQNPKKRSSSAHNNSTSSDYNHRDSTHSSYLPGIYDRIPNQGQGSSYYTIESTEYVEDDNEPGGQRKETRRTSVLVRNNSSIFRDGGLASNTGSHGRNSLVLNNSQGSQIGSKDDVYNLDPALNKQHSLPINRGPIHTVSHVSPRPDLDGGVLLNGRIYSSPAQILERRSTMGMGIAGLPQPLLPRPQINQNNYAYKQQAQPEQIRHHSASSVLDRPLTNRSHANKILNKANRMTPLDVIDDDRESQESPESVRLGRLNKNSPSLTELDETPKAKTPTFLLTEYDNENQVKDERKITGEEHDLDAGTPNSVSRSSSEVAVFEEGINFAYFWGGGKKKILESTGRNYHA